MNTDEKHDYAAAKAMLRKDWATIENPDGTFSIDYIGFTNAVAEHIYTLEDALTRCVWQPIETAPKTGKILLSHGIWISTGRWHENVSLSDGTKYSGFADDSFMPITPTHWQPLPQPPEEV